MAGSNATTTYSSVLEEVSKYSVSLNYAERLWAVCKHPVTGLPDLTLELSLTQMRAGMVPLDAK